MKENQNFRERRRMERFVNIWLKIWIPIMMAVGSVVLLLLVFHWNDLKLPEKLVMALTIALPLHVLEENVIPGGFFFMYNKMKGADKELIDHYPMNPLVDSLTNFSGEVFFLLFLLHGINNSLTVMVAVFGIGESIAHTLGIIKNLQWYKTPYNPGLITVLFCFIPLSIIAITYAIDHSFTFTDWISGIAITLIMVGFSVVGMEKLLKNKNSRYRYTQGKAYGFYDRYEAK